jgi:hypothetical protein
MTPIGFFSYGGMVAIQTLWAGPWMTQVAGWTASGGCNRTVCHQLSMLVSFWLWGLDHTAFGANGACVSIA